MTVAAGIRFQVSGVSRGVGGRGAHHQRAARACIRPLGPLGRGSRRFPAPTTGRCTSCRCAAGCPCWSAPAATSPSPWAATACCSSTHGQGGDERQGARRRPVDFAARADPLRRQLVRTRRLHGRQREARARGQHHPVPHRDRPARVRRARARIARTIISFVTVFQRMSAPTGKVAPRSEDAWPDDTYSSTQKKL